MSDEKGSVQPFQFHYDAGWKYFVVEPQHGDYRIGFRCVNPASSDAPAAFVVIERFSAADLSNLAETIKAVLAGLSNPGTERFQGMSETRVAINRFFEDYECGCCSGLAYDEGLLPGYCPKHGDSWRKRYVSREYPDRTPAGGHRTIKRTEV